MSRPRLTPPERLLGATAFSKWPELLDPMWVVRAFRQTRWISKALEDDLVHERKTNNPGGWGRKRIAGSWPAMVLAFAVSDSERPLALAPSRTPEVAPPRVG